MLVGMGRIVVQRRPIVERQGRDKPAVVNYGRRKFCRRRRVMAQTARAAKTAAAAPGAAATQPPLPLSPFLPPPG
jgi:hypothetical protein